MRFLTGVFSTAALVAGVWSGAAEAARYDCSFRTGVTERTWITERYVIEHDEAAGTATVIDGLIQYYHDKPIEARVVEVTKGKVVFGWTLRTMNAVGQQAVMLYRAAWFKGPGYMRITATPQGYSNMFESLGACTIQ